MKRYAVGLTLSVALISGCTPEHRAMSAAKEAVSAQLKDPGSAQFKNVKYIELLGGQENIVCGSVNARNGFGGFVGHTRFVVRVSKSMQVTYVSFDKNPDRGHFGPSECR